MNKYLIELRLRNSAPVRDSLAFWHERKCVFPCLFDIAQYYLCAPDSQAYAERIFSVCGLMTAGRRNRIEMLVFLQLNSHIIR
jgi:hAT family C-terminal dimerisation region